MALAALCWGLSAGVGGQLIDRGWGPFLVSFYRGAIGLVCILPWLLLRPARVRSGDRRFWLWSGLAGLGVAGNFAFYLLSIEAVGVAVAAPLMYCAPVFVYLVSVLFRDERPSLAKATALLLIMVGVTLLTGSYRLDSQSLSWFGVLWGLLSGASYALFIFAFRFASGHGSAQAILAVALLLLTIVLAGPANPGGVLDVFRSDDWWRFVLLGVLGAGVSFAIYVAGLRRTPPVVASVVAMVEPVTAVLFGVLLLGSSLRPAQYLGVLLILAMATWLSALSAHRS